MDRNRLQQGDLTESTVKLEPLAERWRAFGWSVVEIDGHDIDTICRTLEAAPFECGRPSCVIAHTHKGRGVSFMQDRVEWHHKVPTDQELAAALSELEVDPMSALFDCRIAFSQTLIALAAADPRIVAVSTTPSAPPT